MKRITLQLKLLDPIVISEKSRTEGTHQTLDYIPGSNILGALASKAYTKLKQADSVLTAFDVFHSGQVRFGNAYPCFNQQISYPMPISLHYTKGASDPLKVRNLLLKTKNDSNSDSKTQQKQHRKGYVTKNKLYITTKKTLNTITAINNQTAKAKEGHLFGYQSIQTDLIFQAHIDVDSEELAAFILGSLEELTRIRVGRSKNSNYGRVELLSYSKVDITSDSYQTPKMILSNVNNKDQTNKYLVLWLVSDLIAYNHLGQPSLSPSLLDLGLVTDTDDLCPLDTTKSWIRTRCFSPYNGFRRSYDMEQQAIEKGSILVYPYVEINHEQLVKGLGSYTSTGQGQVVALGQCEHSEQTEWMNLFSEGEITLTRAKNIADQSNIKAVNSPLVDLLAAQYYAIQYKQEINAQVNVDLNDFIKLYRNGRKYHSISKFEPFGPSKTQWGRIRQAVSARNFKAVEDIKLFLFTGNDAIIKKGNEHWDQADNENSFRDLLIKKIDGLESKTTVKTNLVTFYLRSLARELSHSNKCQQVIGA